MALRDLLIRIGGDASGLNRAVEDATKQLGSLRSRFGAAIGGLAAGFSVKAIVDASAEAQNALRELDTVLASTGNTTGLTRQQLLDLSTQLQSRSIFGDDTIQGAETILARFDTLGKETFPRVLQATLDLATRNGDLEGSAMKLGRALQSPVMGLGMLREAGVSFTAQQEAQVKALVASGRTIEAQEILLAGLERAYSGTAAAATETFSGAVAQLGNAFGDLLENPAGLQANVGTIRELTALLQDPRTVEAAGSLTGALFDGFSAVVRLIRGTVEGIREISESIGVFVAGDAASVDRLAARITALDAQIAAYQATADGGGIGSERAARLLEERRAELTLVERQLRVLREYGGFEAPAHAPAASPAAPASAPKPVNPLPVDPQAAAKAAAAAREAYARLRAAVDGELSLLRDEVMRQLADIDRQVAANTLGIADATAQRIAAQQHLVDAELDARRRQLAAATSETDRITITQQIIQLERQRGDVAVDARQRQLDAERTLTTELEGVQRTLQRATGNALTADLAEVEDRYRDLRARLTAEGNTAGLTLVDQVIGAEQGAVKLQDFERRAQAVQDRLAQRQQAIAAQVSVGEITPSQGIEALAIDRQQVLAELRELRTEAEALAAAVGNPEATAAAERFGRAIEQIGSQAASDTQQALAALRADANNLSRTFAQTATSAGVNAFQGLFTDLATGAEDLGGAIKNFARSFAQSLIQISAQALATLAVLTLLESIFPGAGRLAASAGAAIAPVTNAAVRHSGGMADGGGSRRSAPSLALALAPRYQTGGIAGFAPDEVPAVLHRGEEVLTADDPRHRDNGGLNGNGDSGTRILNVVDPSLVEDFMTSASGERVLVNVIRRNPGAVRAALR